MISKESLEKFVDSQIDLESFKYRWGMLLHVPYLLVSGVTIFLALEGHILLACLSTGPGFIAIWQWFSYVMERDAILVARQKDDREK